MSKLGRYSADRKKIDSLSTNKVVEVSNCGTIFVLNSGSTADGTYTASLPSCADAGNGWWCKFVIGEITGGDVLISASADDTTSMFVHKPVSRNDDIYGWGALNASPYGVVPAWSTYAPGFSWGNMPFVTQNIASAGSVRFTISSTASSSFVTGCAHNLANIAGVAPYVNVQPSSSCVVNDTLELVTDGVRWYGYAELNSSVALLDGTADPCTVLSASFAAPGPPPM